MRILTIDPSVNNVGFCLFDSSKRKLKNQWQWGAFALEGTNYAMRMVDLYELLLEKFGIPDHLVTEWPSFFSSAKGHIAAHQNYTIDLAGICGYIAGRMGFNHRQWTMVTATQWKGSVSKDITARKFFRVFGKETRLISEHAIDATMMMHWWLLNYGQKLFRASAEELPVFPQ